MCIVCTEYYFQRMSFINLWWKPCANHLKTKNPNKRKKAKASQKMQLQRAQMKGRVILPWHWVDEKSCTCFEQTLLDRHPAADNRLLAALSFFQLLSLLIREKTEQCRWDECSLAKSSTGLCYLETRPIISLIAQQHRYGRGKAHWKYNATKSLWFTLKYVTDISSVALFRFNGLLTDGVFQISWMPVASLDTGNSLLP